MNIDRIVLVLLNNLCYDYSVKSWQRTLHTHFIPSEENGYQPHFLRLRVAAGMLALVIAIEVLYLAQVLIILPKNSLFAAIFASVLVDQTNQQRLTEQLGTLTKNSVLERAAQMKADDMAAKGYFAHNSPDGKTPWYWFEQAGYDYAAAGENLAVNFTDSKDVTEAWMHSPAHRANIMNGNYTEIGIATAHGMYKGREAVFVVQEFGRLSLVARQTAPESPVVKTEEVTLAPPHAALAVKPTVKLIIPKTKISEKLLVAITPLQISTTTNTLKPIPVSTTTVIAGAETTKLDTPITLATPVVDTTLQEKPSMLDTVIASPRHITTILYLLVTAILLFALSFTIFIKIRIQHPHIIANGVLLIAITLSLVILNAALGFTQGLI